MAVSINWVVHFLDVFVMSSLIGVYLRSPDFWRLPSKALNNYRYHFAACLRLYDTIALLGIWI